ncbi:MAG: response regulator [Deltaproteobacteria bacterium]|nr:response regulator [Deltaproteobacteria bacterium]
MHTILVADDSVTIQQAVEIAFNKEPFSVVKAGSAAEALSRARDARASLVLADHQMPDKSGYELAEALRADPATAQIPVLILTSSAAPYDEARGRAAGAVGNIQKPFDCQSLLERVRALLGVAAGAGVPAGAPVTSAAPISAAVAATPRPPGLGIPPPAGGLPRPPGTSPFAAPPTAPRPAVGQPLAAQPVAAQPVATQPAPHSIGAAATPLSRAATPMPDKGVDPFGFGAAMGVPRPSAANPFTNPPTAASTPAPKAEPSFDISFDDAPVRPAPATPSASAVRPGSFAEAEFLEVADVDIAEISNVSSVPPVPAQTLPPAALAPVVAASPPSASPAPMSSALSSGLAPAPPMARAPTPVASSIADVGRITSKVDLQRLASLDAVGAATTKAMELATTAVVERATPAIAASAGNGAGVSKEAIGAEAREIIERIAWEVVPELAETIIREELQRLLKAR